MVNVRVNNAAMEGEPFKRYKKTILGKVYVTILDPFSDEPTGLILQGNPNHPAELETQIVEVWDARQDSFFRKVNKKHFDAGRLVTLEEEPVISASPNSLSDAEMDVLLDGRQTRFLAFQNRLATFTDEAPIFRLLNRARELEKSEKIIKHIETRLFALQNSHFQSQTETVE